MSAVYLRKWFVAVAILVVPGVAAADVITEWNQKAIACATEETYSAYGGNRVMAIVHTAMFDAVNSIEGRYTPYKVKVAAPPGSSPEAAAVAAAHAALVGLCPGQKAALDAAYKESLAQIPEGSGKAAGIAVGEKVTAESIVLRASDGADAPNTYRPSTGPGVYVPPTLPAGSQWGSVTPWVMERGSQFRPAAPPQLASREWARDYNEVRNLGGKKSTLRTAEQTDIARFWGANRSDIIVRQLAAAPGRSLIENARLFALVEIAIADAFIAVFDAKYTFKFWRPITAIRNGDINGNEDTSREPDWEPLIGTPLDPEYPCGHCITAAAVGAVLESEFGRGPIPVVIIDRPGFFVHKWTSIKEYVDEVSAARIYGGIHYRTSTVVGEAMGRKIGELAVQNYLKPIR